MNQAEDIAFKLRECQRALNDSRDRVESLKNELEQMKEKANGEKQDLEAQISYLKNELQTRGVAIEHLRKRIDEVVSSNVSEKLKTQQITDTKIKELQLALHDSMAKTDQLSIEIAGYEQFSEERKRLIADVAQARQDAMDCKNALQEGTAVFEQRLVAERQKMQSELTERLAELRIIACADAISRLDSLTKQAFQENKDYEQRVRIHHEALRRIDQQREVAEIKANALAEENAILAGQLSEFAKMSHSRKKALEEAKNEINVLKDRLEKEKLRADESVGIAKVVREKLSSEHLENISSLQKRIESLEIQLKRAKATSDRILRERREVERYLLDSLSEVRSSSSSSLPSNTNESVTVATTSFATVFPPKPMSAESSGRMRSSSSGNTNPQQPKSARNSTPTTSTTTTIKTLDQIAALDSRNLSKEQREQVLCVLIAKLHAATIAPTNKKSKPPPPPPPQQQQQSEERIPIEIPSLIPDFLQQQANEPSSQPQTTPTLPQTQSQISLSGEVSQSAMPPIQ